MEQQIPLIIVIAALVVLWFVGRLISKAAEHLPQAAPPAPQPSGKMFAEGLHLSDMSNVLIRELQEIITRQDEKELAYFLARYRPEFIELEEYLSNLRSSYFSALNKPSDVASVADKLNAINAIDLDNPPPSIDINCISKSELRSMIEKNLKTNNNIDMDFMERFGGMDFMDNFHIYSQLTNQKPVTIHADADHQFRQQLEAFVDTGVAQRGRKIPLKERLEVLSFSQLQDIASELKLTTQFSTKSEAAEELAKMPGSAVHLSIIYESDDIFYFKAQSVDPQTIESEYAMLYAYARLLIGSLKTSFVSFDEAAVT
ncbi:MAG: hypothetical protein PVF34_08240 [Gammaproteobacteria bacterium]|jgi:hypothetical protein